MSEQKPREYFLTLNEDGSATHICLNKKLADRPQLQLVERSLFDAVSRELEECRAENVANAMAYRELYIKLNIAVEALDRIGNDSGVHCDNDDSKCCFAVAQIALEKIKGDNDEK